MNNVMRLLATGILLVPLSLSQSQSQSTNDPQSQTQPQAHSTAKHKAQNQAEVETTAEQDRIVQSGFVLRGVQWAGSGIPKDRLDAAKCVIVMPSIKKAAFLVGGTYGRGVMTCRTGEDFKGPWSPPIMMATGGASAGLQAGGQATDYVVLVMTDKAARNLLSGTKVRMGLNSSATAGQSAAKASVGTQEKLRSQTLAYSRTRGLFAGASFAGANLRPDGGGNENLYGRKLKAWEIAEGKVKMPPEAKSLIAELPKEPSVAAATNKESQ